MRYMYIRTPRKSQVSDWLVEKKNHKLFISQ